MGEAWTPHVARRRARAGSQSLSIASARGFIASEGGRGWVEFESSSGPSHPRREATWCPSMRDAVTHARSPTLPAAAVRPRTHQARARTRTRTRTRASVTLHEAAIELHG